jgi:hypothetical protein
MINYLVFEATRYGWRVKNSGTGDAMHYIGYSPREAERAFRAAFNLKYKHFTKIFI